MTGEQKFEMATLAKKNREVLFCSWPEFILHLSVVTLLFGQRCTLVQLEPESLAVSGRRLGPQRNDSAQTDLHSLKLSAFLHFVPV